jgi:HK97 family phage portal protein
MTSQAYNLPPSKRAVDTAWEEASAGWASDSTAITVLEHKAQNTWRLIDVDDLGDSSVTASGMSVGAESALRVGAVFACRRVIAEDVAKMPRLVRQVTFDDAGRQKTRTIWPQSPETGKHDKKMKSIARVLQQRPCEWLTPMQFFEWLVGTAATQRAAYAVPTFGDDGEILELLPITAGSCAPEQLNDWDVFYRVSAAGMSWTAKPGEIMQLTGPLSQTLLEGYSITSMAREAIGLARAIEQSQARFHGRDYRPSGILTTKTPLKPDQRSAIIEEWTRRFGPGGEGGVALLDSEFDFKTMMLTAADSQVLENRNHQVSDICRYFRVFPQLIGHSGNLQGYGTFEQAIESHTKLTLMPWVERLEQALMHALMSREEIDAGYRIHIDVDAIARGTFSDRVKAYGDAIKTHLTPNEVREREGLDPIDDEAMNRVQLLANNTGMQQNTGAKPKSDAKPEPKPEPKPEAKP